MYTLGTHPDFNCPVVATKDNRFCHTDPYPSNDALASFYQSNYREIRREGPTSEYNRFMEARAHVQKSFILEHGKRRGFNNILDIGSGCGALLGELRSHGKSLTGYEPDEIMAKHARENYSDGTSRFEHGLFQPKPETERFDLITMSHVLEHVPHPKTFISALREHTMAPDALFFVEVPNDPLDWVQLQIKWNLKGLAHLNYFTPYSFRQLFKSCGMHVINLITCGMPLSKFIKSRRPKRRLQRIVNRCFPPSRSSLPDYSPDSAKKPGVYIQALVQNLAYKPQDDI